MKRGLHTSIAALLPALAILLAAPASAQEDASNAAHLYESYFKVNYADMAEWHRLFQTYAIPALREMREEGTIEGWGHWEHNVGSEYNVRMAVRFFDWEDIQSFWSAWGARTYGVMTPEDQAANDALVEAHYDEIWNIASANVMPDRAYDFMYASTFQIPFAEQGEWDRMWTEDVLPILGDAMEAGILSGVVLMNHNSGGAHNRKVLYLFEEWDHMDDMWNMFFERMEAEHPDAFGKMLSMVQAHDDVIWSAAPTGNE